MLLPSTILPIQVQDMINYNLGLLNTTFFTKQFTINNIQRVDANGNLDANGEYVKITTTNNHGIDNVSFNNNALLTIRGVKTELNIKNDTVEADGVVYNDYKQTITFAIDGIHNLVQENTIEVELSGFNNPLLNSTFIIQGQDVEVQDQDTLTFYTWFNGITYFTKEALNDLSGTNRKIKILSYTTSDFQYYDFLPINRTLKKSELLFITPNSFVYKADVQQRNLVLSGSTTQQTQVVYSLKTTVEMSLNRFINRVVGTKDAEGNLDNRMLIILDRGESSLANATDAYGRNTFTNAKKMQYGIDILLLWKNDTNTSTARVMQEIANTRDSIMQIMANARSAYSNMFEFEVNNPIDYNGLTPFDDDAGILSSFGIWYKISFVINCNIAWERLKRSKLSFGYDGIALKQDYNNSILSANIDK